MASTGRSIAVASSRSVCVLERSQQQVSVNSERRYANSQTQKDKGAPGRYNLQQKWHFFGNESEEKAFRVIAMTWWESRASLKSKKVGTPNDNYLTDDLLVAIIQLQEDDDNSQCKAGTCFLACWSQRR